MSFRDDQKLEVQQATDIVRLIGEQIALKPRGKEFLGLCPFHDDKNPSMHVSPAKQIYKCFSCSAGGDVFSFVMNYHKMTFPEALKLLADRAGIKLVQAHGPADRGHEEGPTDRQCIADANAKAIGFFRALYRHGEHGQIARAYVEKRRISPEMIEAFQIGYASDRWDGLVMMIQEKNWDRRAFELAGLVSPRTNGQGLYDRLRHRLIFPIFDAIGRPIAFGGRKLREEDEPKYLNSPETPLFNKSATLYGLHLAKQPIINSKTAVIVEGYTDVIACHQAGIKNVVATLGTALTIQHVQTLRHFAEKVVLIYDGDEAGQKAADRAVEVFLTGSMDVAFAVLPDGLDPAELLELSDGVEQWNRAVAQSTDALDYQFRRVRSELESAQTVTGRQRVAEEYLTKLAQLGLEQMPMLRKAMVMPRLAELLHLSEQSIHDLLKRLAPVRRGGGASASPGATSDNAVNNPLRDVALSLNSPKMKALVQAERHLIGCLLRQPDLFHQILADGGTLDETVTPAELLTASGKRLYERIYQRLCDGVETTMQSLLVELAETEADLTALVTQADADVEACVGEQSERILPLLQSAASAILAYHRELEYERTRQALADRGADDSDQIDQAQILKRLLEHRKAHPSPGRIARLES